MFNLLKNKSGVLLHPYHKSSWVGTRTNRNGYCTVRFMYCIQIQFLCIVSKTYIVAQLYTNIFGNFLNRGFILNICSSKLMKVTSTSLLSFSRNLSRSSGSMYNLTLSFTKSLSLNVGKTLFFSFSLASRWTVDPCKHLNSVLKSCYLLYKNSYNLLF